MLIKHSSIIVCILLLLTAVPVYAGVKLSVGGGYLSGDTQYQIGGRLVTADGSVENIHFPLSELIFPLDSYVVKAQADLDFAQKWELMFSAETNLTDDTGKMEDSDWGIFDPSEPDRLDIFSESDTEMDMYALEAKLTYRFFQAHYGQNAVNPALENGDIRFLYKIGLGYKYQDYDFEIYDLDQWYPSVPAAGHDYADGLGLTYEAKYQIPYLELSMEMDAKKKFFLELGLAYAPFIKFEDEDHHLLRDKVNVADHGWDGDALKFNLNMRYQLTRHWFLKAEFETMQIESEGEADSYLHGVWNHRIDHEISSQQDRAFLSLGASF